METLARSAASLGEALGNPTLRRFAVYGASSAAIALNKKLGLEITADGLMELTGLALGYLAASNWKEASLAKSDATAKAAVVPRTAEQDAAILAGAK